MIKNKIREIRKLRGLTLRQLAGLCKLNPKTGARTIQRLEVYESDLNTKWMDILSKALDVRPAELIGDNVMPSGGDEIEGLKAIFEIITRKARAYPSVPESVAAHIALSQFLAVREGRISGGKATAGTPASPKAPQGIIARAIMENEIARLFEYEAGKMG